MKRYLLVSLLLLGHGGEVHAQVEWHGAVTVDVASVNSESSSFLDHGFGPFGFSGEPDGRGAGINATAELGLKWEPTPGSRVVVHGLARYEDEMARPETFGVVEAFFDGRRAVGDRHELGVRGGVFFPPTSMENVEDRWTSPYTLTFSAINSWVAEESRDLGLEARWTVVAERGRFTVGGSLLGGNDTSGTLLAWRGFALHDRVTTLGEWVALPALATLGSGGIFAAQKNEGTQPFGEDLDGRIGWAARVAWLDDVRGTRLRLRIADNRADRGLHDHQYAWRTRTVAGGLSTPLGEAWTLAGEVLAGETGMGVPPHFVDIDFAAAYLLLSRQWSAWRASVRLDGFRTRDRDGSIGEVSDQDGAAVTLALLTERGGWRAGIEFVVLAIDRPSGSGFDERADGQTLRLELRRGW